MPIRRWYGNQQWECKKTIIPQGFKCNTPSGEFVIKASRHDKGCYSVGPISKTMLIGVYPGFIINERNLLQKMGTLPFETQKFVSRYLVQSKLHSTEKSKCYLDPTNKYGVIDPSFECNPVLYINEPDSDQSSNVHSVWNYDNDRLELWSTKDIKEGNELFVSYGPSYNRDYSASNINSSEYIFLNGVLQLQE